MTTTDASRLATLEKRLAEVATQMHYHDAQRVVIEKAIGVIDQQLIRTDRGVFELRILVAGLAKKAGKPVSAKPASAKPAKPAKRAAKPAKRGTAKKKR